VLPKALLLDLDDTILDDSGGLADGWKRACGAATEHGVDAARLLEEVHRYRLWYWSDPERHREGRLDLRAASAHIVGEALKALGHEKPELAAAIGGRYRDLRDAAIRPLPGAVEALEAFRAAGVKLALLTNGAAAAQRRKIERFDLAKYFDHVHVEGERGFGKPDERVYAGAVAALGVSRGEAWSVGDNLVWEVAVPKRMGFFTVWVNRHDATTREAEERPDRVVRSIAELV
jgi:putative hydrolase of the HAD superfamily